MHGGRGGRFAKVTAILAGKPVGDGWVVLNPPGIVGDHGWNPPDPGAAQALVCIDDDAAFMLTFGRRTMIEALWVPGDGRFCGAEHWIVTGDGSEAWRAATIAAINSKPSYGGRNESVLMRLTGRHYDDKIDPPVEVGPPSEASPPAPPTKTPGAPS